MKVNCRTGVEHALPSVGIFYAIEFRVSFLLYNFLASPIM